MWWLYFLCQLPTNGLIVQTTRSILSRRLDATNLLDNLSAQELGTPRIPTTATPMKEELLRLGSNTLRGFQATSSERKRAKELIGALAEINPSETPASAYYTAKTESMQTRSAVKPSAAGKWSLIYTDAPDITSLQQTTPFVELGRIGQNCNPPFIENVIEWKRPSWMPAIGPASIVQKVVTQGLAIEDSVVNLELSGVKVEASEDASWLPPLDLSRGFITLPFGRFTILYLDDDLRITRTGQNYVAVNQRIDPSDEWF